MERTLDRLSCEQPCLGVICSTFAFDPDFFENQFLRAVLRLGADPVEQPQRYHAEALRAIQETPVAVLVDAGQRQSGRRLPYDVLEIQKAVFHPKSVLLLFEDQARLMVGSGNLTFAGYSQNTELFVTLDLRYDAEQDATFLRSFDGHLERIAGLSRQLGSQLSLVREELSRRIATTADASTLGNYVLLDSTESPIIDQIRQLVPDGAKIHRIGMAAPFYERDDGGALDASSVFSSLEPLLAKDVTLDASFRWDNSQVAKGVGTSKLANGLGQLWAWKSGDKDDVIIEYLVPQKTRQSTFKYVDHRGESRQWNLNEALEAIESGHLWKLPTPVAFAPRKSLTSAQDVYSDVRFWLHPSQRLIDGRAESRPLHAKLLLVTFKVGKAVRTIVVMGSANMSRRALLQDVQSGANVELGIAMVVEGELAITDFIPELVSVPTSLLDLKEQEFPEGELNWAIAIESAVHDAANRNLTITWSEHASGLPPWRLLYQGNVLQQSDQPPPTGEITELEFVLQASSAEVVLEVTDQEFSVPVLVFDLVALPVVDGGASLNLDDLLLMLGRRMGAEQAIYRAQNRVSAAANAMENVFGEGITPTDVFRAWWTVANDLQEPSLSINAFRLHLEGSLSVGHVWKRMLEAVEDQEMDSMAVWFYGSELLGELDQVELPGKSDRDAKLGILNSFTTRLRSDLARISIPGDDPKWVQTIRKFYAGQNS